MVSAHRKLTERGRSISYGVGGVISLLSLIGITTSTEWVRKTSSITLTAGLTLISSTVFQLDDVDVLFKDHLDKTALENERVLKTLSELSKERETNGQTLEQYKTQLSQYVTAYRDVSAQNGVLRGELDRLSLELDKKTFDESTTYRNLVKGFTDSVMVELNKLVDERLVKISEFITDKLPKFEGTPTHEHLTKLLELINHKRAKYLDIISKLTPDYDNPHNDLLEFVDIFNQIHDEVSSIKVRFKNCLTVNERLRLKESVDRKYAVDQLEKLAKSQDEFQLSYTEALDELERLVDVVEQHRAVIQDLNNQLEAAKAKPIEFNPASRDDLRMANLIIKYYHRQGIWLDRGYSKFKGHKATVSFLLDRNDPPIEVKQLNEKSEALQDLLKCLNQPEFKRNPDTGMVDVTLEITEKPKVEATQGDDDINRIWKPASEFKKICSEFSRVRITGGSEAGKSPTAENLAVTILENRPGKAVLYNPQFDSSKNYWTIPTVGKSHEDSARGIKSLASLVKSRSDGVDSRDEHRLYIFDEIDSTMSESSNAREIGESVKYIIKQASHQNLSAIFIGQSANVSNYPGMQRTDWNSAVNIHIGANAYDALVNSNQFTTKQCESLRTQADRLTEYCERKNTELGLDGKNPKAYRFALVIEPNKTPYFIELPEFGLYTYSEEHALTSSQKALEGSTTNDSISPSISLSDSLEPVKETSNSAVATLTVICPSCSSENVARNGKYKDKQRFKCLNDLCSRKTFTV